MSKIASEADLLHRLRQRDQSALAEVFEVYSDRIYRLALSLLHDEQSADGVVQDTFISLIEHIDGFEGRSSLGTWLYRVAYNHCMGRLRRVRPQVPLLEEVEDNLDQPIMPTHLMDWRNLPEALFGSSEAMQQMTLAIQGLAPSLRAVFILRDVEERSTEETAQIMAISPGAVKVRLHRARLALREALADYFEGEYPPQRTS
jgi:RNA polymerase sigma-70 factor (ECF subfamily)